MGWDDGGRLRDFVQWMEIQNEELRDDFKMRRESQDENIGWSNQHCRLTSSACTIVDGTNARRS